MNSIKRSNVSIPALMNEIFKPDWFGGSEVLNAHRPAVNIKESDTEFELALMAPGRTKEDFNIEIDDHVLTVSTAVTDSEDEAKENYTIRAFSLSSFKRAFSLPNSVKEEAIKASYTAGILYLTLPKKEEALPKPKRAIDIQ